MTYVKHGHTTLNDLEHTYAHSARTRVWYCQCRETVLESDERKVTIYESGSGAPLITSSDTEVLPHNPEPISSNIAYTPPLCWLKLSPKDPRWPETPQSSLPHHVRLNSDLHKLRVCTFTTVDGLFGLSQLFLAHSINLPNSGSAERTVLSTSLE